MKLAVYFIFSCMVLKLIKAEELLEDSGSGDVSGTDYGAKTEQTLSSEELIETVTIEGPIVQKNVTSVTPAAEQGNQEENGGRGLSSDSVFEKETQPSSLKPTDLQTQGQENQTVDETTKTIESNSDSKIGTNEVKTEYTTSAIQPTMQTADDQSTPSMLSDDEAGTTAVTTATENPCSKVICKNGGTCMPNQDDQPKCLCLSDFEGPNCSIKKLSVPRCTDKLFFKISSDSASLDMSKIQFSNTTTHLRVTLFPTHTLITKRMNIARRFMVGKNKTTINNLSPGTIYNVSLISMSILGNTTYKSEPGCQNTELWTKPVDINCSDVNIADVTATNVMVNLPSVKPSDGITHFRVIIKTNVNRNRMLVSADNKTLTIPSLVPATLYNITVRGVSSINNKTQRSRPCDVFSNYTYPLLNCSLLRVEEDEGNITIITTNTTAPKTSQLRLDLSAGNFLITRYINTTHDGSGKYSSPVERGKTYNTSVTVRGGGDLWSQTSCRHTVSTYPTSPNCQNVFTIPYNASIFIDLTKVKTVGANHYKIKELETGQIRNTIQSKPYATYVDLSPGKQYTFHISAVGFNGLESKESCTYIASTRPNAPVCVQRMFEDVATNMMVINTSVLKATGSKKYRIELKKGSSNEILKYNSTGKTTVGNLQPGTNYKFHIVSLSSNNTESSTGCFISRYTYPASPGKVHLPKNATDGNLTIRWDASNGLVDSYHVNISCNCATSCDVIPFNVTSPMVQISGVSLGSSCTFTVYAIAGGLLSRPRVITTQQTAPDAVRQLAVRNITDTTVLVSWSTPMHPNSKSLIYRIDLIDVERSKQLRFDIQVTVNMSSRNVTHTKRLDNLNPGTCYTVAVTAENDAGLGPNVTTRFYSAESVPGMVTNSTTSSITSSSLSVSWQEPTVKNGVITNYTVIVTQISQNSCMKNPPSVCTTKISLYCEDCERGCQDAVSAMDAIEETTNTENCLDHIEYPFYQLDETFNVDVEKLMPFTKYKLDIYASNSAGKGSALELNFRTSESVSDRIRLLTLSNATSNSVTFSFARPYCTNGDITSFQVEYKYRERNDVFCFQNASRAREVTTRMYVSHKSVAREGNKFSLLVLGLFSYWTYSFQIAAINRVGQSTPRNIDIVTQPAIPDPVDVFYVQFRDPYFVQVVWREPCFPNGIIKQYVLRTINKEIVNSTNIPGNVTSWTIRNLLPDRSYRVQIVAVNDAGHGNITERNITTPATVPYKPRHIIVYTMNATAINVTWSLPSLRTGRTHYIASATDGDTNQIIARCEKQGFTSRWCVISGLDEYWGYRITVSAQTGNGTNSTTLPGLVRTRQAAPGKIRNLQIFSQRDAAAPRQVNVTWEPPSTRDQNGIITGYILKYWMKEKNEDKKIKEVSETAVYNLDLIPEKEYIFQVQAKTVTVGSFSEEKSVVVEAGAPPLHLIASSQPMIQAGPSSLVTDEEQQFSITLNVLTLCDRTYGNPSSWGIIVAESSQASDDAYRGSRNIFNNLKYKRYRTWSEIRNSETISPYIASDKWKPPCIQGRTKRAIISRVVTTSLLIGADGECEGARKICNGFLKPATEYRVRVWVCTNGGCSESPYSKVIRTEKSQVPTIAGSITGFIIFIIAACIVVFVLRKKQIGPFREKYEIDDEVFTESKGMEMKRKTGPQPVALDTFTDHVQSMHQDSNLGFSKEYKMIKDTCPHHSTVAAEAQATRMKNRYTNILPYDHCRVKLLPMDDEEGSDFINANYMPGFNSKREYIATQGPQPCTKDDFWRMIWEQNVSIIVMVTQIIERGRIKCECYWPETLREPVYFGDLIVELESESTLPDYVIRIISVKVGNKKKRIQQLHFLKWPDMGCPETTWLLLNFAQSVRLYVPHVNPGPIVVHCSAGVGRTGTFIAVDHLMQHVRQNSFVDVYGVVMGLRNNRPNMVQTEDQYIFIHDCIKDFIINDEDDEAHDGGEEPTYQNV